MLIPMLHEGSAYYMMLPIFWPMFLIIYYVIPAYIVPYCMKHCVKIASVETKTLVVSGIWAFFFALPFVHAFADNFVFLFFITTRSLLLFALANVIFQYLYIQNVSTLTNKKVLLTVCMTAMTGYWAVSLFYYAFSYVFVTMRQAF